MSTDSFTMRKTQIVLLLSAAATIGFVSCHRNGKISKEFSEETLPDSKKGKIFSIFSIVTFKNSQCTTKSDSTMKGSCFTASECATRGGTASGNCAAGFGVCCMFTVSTCGSTVTQNVTYIQNPSYPSSYPQTSITCSYSISPIQSDICQLRLDFNNFITAVATDGLCTDSFVSTSPTGLTNPNICGTNTNQHMYIETGTSTTPTNLAFTIASTTVTRTWKIKVSQIECSNLARAPADCRQYFTGTSGTVQSFNFVGGVHLMSMQYNNCFRQELGYCAIDFAESASTSPDPFQVGKTPTSAGTLGQTNCGAAGVTALIIPSDQAGQTLYCGAALVTIAANTVPSVVRENVAPFTLGVISNGMDQGSPSGFNLVFTQVPCA